MPTLAIYRCPKCGTEYRPLDAGARRFICCGVSLARVGHRQSNPLPPQRSERAAPACASSPAALSQHPTELIEVIPPRENMVDALAVATLLNTFATGSLFALEMAGDHQSRRFFVRGTPEGAAHIRRQLQATYDQVSFRQVSAEEDPGRPSELPTAGAHLTLSRPAYLPVRTFENGDFETADPVKGLLGAFDGLQPDERALTQIILSPAPPQWSRRYEGSAHQVEKSLLGEAMSLGLIVRQCASVISVTTAIAFGLWALLSFMQRAWLTFFIAGILFSGAAFGVMWLYSLISEQANIDPKLVQTKIATPAFNASIRLFVVGQTQKSAQWKLQEIVAAYRRLNLQSGNSFVAQPAEFDPRVISLAGVSWLKELTARVTRLSTDELASLWHLPVGAEVVGVERTLVKRLLPRPADVQTGVLIGTSVHQGQRVPVHLSEDALWHHIFMVAKTQKGKSTLMAHLAAEAMRRDSALVVIDPHGDLVRSIMGLVPKSRVDDVMAVDLSDPERVVGLNLLDLTQGRNADTIVSNIVHLGELLWRDNWGPRMEDALRMALRTLLAANQVMLENNRPQFTLIDIPPLLQLPNFRYRLIDRCVRDQAVLQWWSGYFERLYEKLSLDVINPVLTKIHRFANHSVVRNIVGQSTSTVNFRALLEKRGILLVNTATGIIGPDAGGLLGAVLVDTINFAVRDQIALADPTRRARVIVIVDEFQSIPGVDYPGLLAELQKMGASFILATQALGQLDAIDPRLRNAILSNANTLCVFQTSAEDAVFLQEELDRAVEPTDIINLSNFTCYVKTQVQKVRLPVMHVETLAPAVEQADVVQEILGRKSRYTQRVSEVEASRREFQELWYGNELTLMRQLMSLKAIQARKEQAAAINTITRQLANSAAAERAAKNQTADRTGDTVAGSQDQPPLAYSTAAERPIKNQTADRTGDAMGGSQDQPSLANSTAAERPAKNQTADRTRDAVAGSQGQPSLANNTAAERPAKNQTTDRTGDAVANLPEARSPSADLPASRGETPTVGWPASVVKQDLKNQKENERPKARVTEPTDRTRTAPVPAEPRGVSAAPAPSSPLQPTQAEAKSRISGRSQVLPRERPSANSLEDVDEPRRRPRRDPPRPMKPGLNGIPGWAHRREELASLNTSSNQAAKPSTPTTRQPGERSNEISQPDISANMKSIPAAQETRCNPVQLELALDSGERAEEPKAREPAESRLSSADSPLNMTDKTKKGNGLLHPNTDERKNKRGDDPRANP